MRPSGVLQHCKCNLQMHVLSWSLQWRQMLLIRSSTVGWRKTRWSLLSLILVDFPSYNKFRGVMNQQKQPAIVISIGSWEWLSPCPLALQDYILDLGEARVWRMTGNVCPFLPQLLPDQHFVFYPQSTVLGPMVRKFLAIAPFSHFPGLVNYCRIFSYWHKTGVFWPN